MVERLTINQFSVLMHYIGYETKIICCIMKLYEEI